MHTKFWYKNLKEDTVNHWRGQENIIKMDLTKT